MIVDLPDTTASKISKALVTIREEGGAVALGRVLTLVISTTLGHEEEAIEAANDASREHPMRVIVISKSPGTDPAAELRLDAQIRVGGDAGASEVILLKVHDAKGIDDEGLVMGLLLPDTPVVGWWPGVAPEKVSESTLGRIAQCRITDSAAQADPGTFLQGISENYSPGDVDFAWTRLTLWRAQLAAVLDQPPYEPVTGVQVHGSSDSPSTLLLAAWLQLQLKVPVEYELTLPNVAPIGIHGVTLTRQSGTIRLERPHSTIATLTQ
ncbi:MAG TPA: glucose-6-phosphate dehydrogenase assembly protein OpcA, partial [Homoserinimonas sp.]|nr:glucose-6-phosphate dehydrogenase assembly protein OpcA [Homoserinimonas sp.]